MPSLVEPVGYPWDTPGQPEYDRIRPLMYPDTQIFILTYAVDRRSSFENIRRVWVPELAFNHWPATRGTHPPPPLLAWCITRLHGQFAPPHRAGWAVH